EQMRVVDMSVWPPRVVSSFEGGGHGVDRATINGAPFLLHSDETSQDQGQAESIRASGCAPYEATPAAGAAEAFLTDISDETAPARVSTLSLAINEPEHCDAHAQSAVNSTIHYHEVDNPNDTTFAMLSMKNAGLRVFDVRNPEAPTEVAYFNPAMVGGSFDRARMHPHYDAATGHIWATTERGGFWVLELEPQVRAALGLPATENQFPNGRPARPPAPSALSFTRPALTATSPDLDLYCEV
ncbi:MAG: hypothetical protein ACRDPR_02135, partial [Nocardioidaceae bacterium]